MSSEAMYRMLIENLPQKMYLKDKDSVYISCNQNMARDLKINADEIAGKTDYDLFPKSLAVKHRADDVRVMDSGLAEEIESSQILKGKVTYTRSVKTPVKDGDGNITGLLGVTWDVTGYKKSEEELEKRCQDWEDVVNEHVEELRKGKKRIEWDGIERRRWMDLFDSLLNSSTAGIYITYKGKLVECNPKFSRITGYSMEKLRGRISSSLIFPADRDAARKGATSMLKGQSHVPYEFRLTSKDGGVRWVMEIVTPVIYKGKRAALGNFMDITKRKQAEEALRAAEEKYRLLVENINDVLYVLDPRGNITYISPAVERFTRYKVSDLMGKPFAPLIHPDDLPALMDSFSRLVSGQLEPWEFRIVDKDGRVIFVRSSSRPVYEDGQVVGITAVISDINERKKAEQALRASNELLALFIKHSPIFTYIKAVNPTESRVLFASDNFQDMIGIPGYDMMGKTMEELFSDEQAAQFTADDWAVVASGETLRTNEDLNGRNYNTIKFPIVQGDKTLLAGYTIDITERKQAEDAVRESEAKYRLLADHTADGVWLLDLDLKLIYCSPSSAKQSGFTVQEIMGMSLEQYFSPESLKAVTEAYLEQMPRAEADPDYNVPITLDLEFKKKDGTAFWAECRFGIIRDEHGKPVSILAVARDITERRQVQEELRQARDYLENLLEHANAPIIVWDTNLRITRFNRAFEYLTGLKSEYAVGKQLDILFSPGRRDKSMSHIKRALSGEHWEAVEISTLHTDGTERVVLWNSATIYAEDGRTVIATIAQGQDITARKRVEEALRRNERETVNLVENIPDMVVRFDTDLRYTYCNRAVEQSLGIPASTLIGKTPMEVDVPSGPAEFIEKALRRALKMGQEQEVEQSIALPSGTRHLLTRIVPERDDNGRMESLLAITRDITPRKQAEAALLENERENRELVEQLHRLVGNTITAQEAERERICLEVHDGVAQTVASAYQYLQGIESNLPADSPDADLIGKAKAQMKHAIQEAREVVSSLQPAALKDLGLIPTLRQEMHRIEEENGWTINFDAQAQRYPAAIEIGLYRIIHEAITNIKKHTHTRGVDISIMNDGQYINVLIKDHGKGFDKDAPDIQKKKGIGLISMRKRAELLQGTLNIESIRGQGTAVMIKIPFDGRV